MMYQTLLIQDMMNLVEVDTKKLHFSSETIAENRFRRDCKTHRIDFIFSLELVHTIGIMNLQYYRGSPNGDSVVVAATWMKLTQNTVNIPLRKDLHWFLQ